MTKLIKATNKYLFEEVLTCLNNSGVFIYPTETLYGIGCLAFNNSACKKILDIKGRSASKGLIILVKDEFMLEKYFFINKSILKKYSRIEKPLTIILKCRKKFPNIVSAGTENVAVRISSNPFVKELFNHIDEPITSTSANISGSGNLIKINDIYKYFFNKVDLIVDSGNIPPSKGSAIVDLTKKPPEIIRNGDLSLSEIKEFLSG